MNSKIIVLIILIILLVGCITGLIVNNIIIDNLIKNQQKSEKEKKSLSLIRLLINIILIPILLILIFFICYLSYGLYMKNLKKMQKEAQKQLRKRNIDSYYENSIKRFEKFTDLLTKHNSDIKKVLNDKEGMFKNKTSVWIDKFLVKFNGSKKTPDGNIKLNKEGLDELISRTNIDLHLNTDASDAMNGEPIRFKYDNDDPFLGNRMD